MTIGNPRRMRSCCMGLTSIIGSTSALVEVGKVAKINRQEAQQRKCAFSG